MRNMLKTRAGRDRLFAALYGTFLVLAVAFILLEAFVIPSAVIAAEEETVSPGLPEGEMNENIFTEEPAWTDHSYTDSRICIQIRQMRIEDTDIWIADVYLRDPACLRTALAGGSFGRNLEDYPSVMAEENDAILAINGDYYGFRATGYVMRGGQLYRESRGDLSYYDDLVIYENGHLENVDERTRSARELADRGAREIFSFGPGLVEEGEVCVTPEDEVDRAQEMNPRTAIGEAADSTDQILHYYMVVSDGRTDRSPGFTLLELAELMKDLGCRTAYNLDGGGSSTMWFRGEVLNNPTTFGKEFGERSISDILYIGL